MSINYSAFRDLKISFVGLGYVGLPLLIAFSKATSQNDLNWDIVGFDIDQNRITELNSNFDKTCEVSDSDLLDSSSLTKFTCLESDLAGTDVFIVTVPTPIKIDNTPDLFPLESASSLVGRVLSSSNERNDLPLIIFESTVYPGATQNVCVPILERYSGLKYNVDFFVGYSPERINPGDKSKSVTSIVKVTSGSSLSSADFVDQLYSIVITAGTYKAPSIIVAEAAKIIENIQRDVNIALVNELSQIFRLMNIDTQDVLSAASTKWNFHRYTPGLVGGHCIGVDPYYLTYRASQLGYNSRIVLAGRQLNDEMPQVIVKSILYECAKKRIVISGENILLLGFTFKENCPDIRNSKALDLYSEFSNLGCDVSVVDPCADVEHAKRVYDVQILRTIPSLSFACVILVVNHDLFARLPREQWLSFKNNGSFLVDIKSSIVPRDLVDFRV